MLASHLRELLREGLVLNFGRKLNSESLTVTEIQNTDSDKLCEFTILDLPPDSIAFTLDPNHSSELRRKSSKNFTWLIRDEPKRNIGDDPKKGREKIDSDKKCDFVLLSSYNGIPNIIIGELKSGNIRPKRYQAQLLNSFLIVKYIVDLLETYYLKDELSPIFRLVVFSNSDRSQRDKPINTTYKTTKFPINLKNNKIKISFVKVKNGMDIKYIDIFKEIENSAVTSTLLID